MMTQHERPFHSITPKGWQNLAMAATLTFYLILSIFLLNTEFCGHLGHDYCAYWSAGKIMREDSFGAVYKPDRLLPLQENLYPQSDHPDIPFEVIPLPYLPVFLLPFYPLSLFSPPGSFALWTLINLVGMIFYLCFFAKKTMGESPPARLILMLTLSLPVFVNLYQGQLNLWLMVCAGEFMRGMLAEKPLKAGLWLGGWLLKPQILILILPFLLFRRELKALIGFAVSALAVLGTSFALVGMEGALALKDIWLGSSAGGQASNAGVMMNWRMLGENVGRFTTPTAGWAVIILGTLLTISLALVFFRNKKEWDNTRFAIALLGLFAATCVIAWHAHVHTAMILIPPIFFLLEHNQLDRRLFSLWLFVPPFFQLVGYLLAGTIHFNNYLDGIYLVYFLGGITGLLSNLLLLGLASRKFTQTENKDL